MVKEMKYEYNVYICIERVVREKKIIDKEGEVGDWGERGGNGGGRKRKGVKMFYEYNWDYL